MTTINIHGILGHEFKSVLKLSINKSKEVIDAISCSYPLFRHRINELSQQGIQYSMLVDGEALKTMEQLSIKRSPKVIDIIPTICGSGPAIAAVGALALAGSAFTGTAIAFGTVTWATVLSQVGVMLLGIGLQMALAPKPDMKRQESTVSGAKQSFMIASKANTIEQGVPVPVGYGRLRVGSAIIQSTIKSYPQNYSTVDALAGSLDNGIGIVTKGKE
jgi:predicted phage tail protein